MAKNCDERGGETDVVMSLISFPETIGANP